MKGISLLFILFLSSSYCLAEKISDNRINDSLIIVLKKEIAQRDIYVQRKLDLINILRKDLFRINELSTLQKFDLYNSFYHQYKTFIYDSAFKYASKLIETAYILDDQSRIGYARIKTSFILLSSGMFKEAMDSLNVVDVAYLDDSTKANYHWLIGKAYADLNLYNKDNHYRKYYTDLNQRSLDSALRWCKPDTYQHHYLIASKNGQINNYQKVIDTIEELIHLYNLTNPQLAINYFDLGQAYRGLNQLDKTIQFTILSSLSDIRAATKETAAMYTLAKLLYEQGDVSNAHIFIQQALEDAKYYGARQRMVEIGSILPLIATAELNNSESQRKLWLGYAIGLSVLFALVLLLVFVVFRQLKKLKAAELKIMQTNNALQETNHKLTDANKIKEEYIGYYFSINSEYLNKIESFKQTVEQKLVQKKYDDIKFIVNNINAKREREELYFGFDKVFLKLFPDFIKTFNSYFNSEDQFIVKEGQLLNTELRIFALIRMGITDSEDIARILDYSVNTIYAYKTKIRNKSILPNDEFDRKIMEIKAI